MTHDMPASGAEQSLPRLTWDEACRVLYKTHKFVMRDEAYRKHYNKNYENRAAELDFVPEKEDPHYAVIYNRFKYKSAAAEGKCLQSFRTEAMNIAWHRNLNKFGKIIVGGPNQASKNSSDTRRKKSMHGLMRVMAHNMLQILQHDDARINLAIQAGVEYKDLQRIKNDFVVLPKWRVSTYFSASQRWLKKAYQRCEHDYCSSRDTLIRDSTQVPHHKHS